MGKKTSFNICLQDKQSIDILADFTAQIPEDELHVLEGTDISERLEGIKNASLSLVAEADRRYGVPDYMIGHLDALKIRHVEEQSTPLALNARELGKREKKEFRGNACYVSYTVSVLSPPKDVRYELTSTGAGRINAPWALPDMPYRPGR